MSVSALVFQHVAALLALGAFIAAVIRIVSWSSEIGAMRAFWD